MIGFYSEKQKQVAGSFLYKDNQNNFIEVTCVVEPNGGCPGNPQNKEYEDYLCGNFDDMKIVSRNLTDFVEQRSQPSDPLVGFLKNT